MTTIVIGGGAAGLVAARRLLLEGESVTLLDSWNHLGGRVGSGELGGITVDTGAESFAVRGGTVQALLESLDLTGAIAAPNASAAWVALPDRIVPLPALGVMGIPAVPLATDVVRVLDWPAAVRAQLDRVLPSLRVGRYDRLGPLVRARMGQAVLDRLVTPVVQSVYGVHPDDVRVDDLLPALNGAMTAAGSLGAAVQRMRAAAPPGAAVGGLDGGVHTLITALREAVLRFGGSVQTDTAATALRTGDDGRWRIDTASRGRAAGTLEADRVLVATDGAAAWRLLDQTVPGLAALPTPSVAVSRIGSFLIRGSALDAAPRGTGVLVAPDRTDVLVRAITHASVKWPWLAARLPDHHHVVRIFSQEPVSDARASQDLALLLGGGAGGVGEVLERVDSVWHDTAPALAPATLERRRVTAAAVAEVPGLAVAGSWMSGTGLASVVAGADAAARSLLSEA